MHLGADSGWREEVTAREAAGGTTVGDYLLNGHLFASVRGGREERRQHKDWTNSKRGRGQASPLIRRHKSLGKNK